MTVTGDSTSFRMGVTPSSCEVTRGEALDIRIRLENNFRQQQWITVKLYRIDGGILTVCAERNVYLNNFTAGSSRTETCFSVSMAEMTCGKHTLYVTAEANGNVSSVTVGCVYLII